MTLGVSSIVWLSFMQLAASGIGGYLAGRLRTKWVSVHTDEVYFRDTAHGFLAWAVATLVTAATLTSAIGSILGTGAQAAGPVAGAATTIATAAAGPAAASANGGSVGLGYFIDSLMRKDPGANPSATGDAAGAPPNGEIARIFANDLRAGSLPAEDAHYVGQLVAQRTGLAPADAEKRVTDTFAKVQSRLKEADTATREAADKARKASAGAAMWLFVSLLIGAFVASYSATFGGRRRDL
jgi:hypothetical protein